MKNSNGHLVVVPTPLGNLNDASPRLKEALEQADAIAAEDTRRTGRLLQQLGLPKKRLLSHHDHNERQSAAGIVKLLEQGQNIALVSDGGTPGVSDPGATLVAAAHAANIAVSSLPGPCAATTAMAASGLPGPFTVWGFPPRTPKKRIDWAQNHTDWPTHHVFYEAPNRLIALLEVLAAEWGDRPALLARELTKIHEEFLLLPLPELLAELQSRDALKGECTLVVAGQRK